MNRKEYEEKLKLLTEQLEYTNKQIEELKKIGIEKYYYFIPILDESYWYIDHYGDVYRDVWGDCIGDGCKFNIGNVFRTEEEAKFEVERLKVLAELKKFSRNFEVHKNKYCIKYDMISKNIDVYNNYGYATGELRFVSEKDAKDAIEFVGEDRVIKYYLGVEE